jgi:tRNA threonylcarbamoyladenosine biosynthesis protein TsaE
MIRRPDPVLNDAPPAQITKDERETLALASGLARTLGRGSVVALTGPLGAGKTVFVKGLAQGLGIDPDRVHSPTFTFVNSHTSAGGTELYHVDLFRLRDKEDAMRSGFGELLAGDAIVAVEWAERAGDLIPPDAVWVEMEMDGGGGRRVRVRTPEGR